LIEVKVQKKLKGFNLSLNFSSLGRTTALFGPSGSGKSLTLKAVAGLLKPDRGRIEVKGRTLFDSDQKVNLPPQRRREGFLFQDYALFPHMTVWGNVSFGAKDRKRVEELLELFQIEEIRDKYPSQISGGQRQRVAFARALASRPEILLLDEPFSALDRNLKEELYAELKRIQELYDLPALIVTHDFEEVFGLADWLAVVEGGRTLQEGRPEDLFFGPNSLKTARLLGHKSFIEGRVKEVGRWTVVELPSGRLLKCRKGDFRPGEEVFVSVLPFSLALSFTEESNPVKILVERVEKGREINKIFGIFEGKRVELHIPAPLSPNFIFQRGRESSIRLSAEHLPVIRRRG